MVSFDTLKFVQTFEAGGFERTQAEGITIAFRDAFAEHRHVRAGLLKAGQRLDLIHFERMRHEQRRKFDAGTLDEDSRRTDRNSARQCRN